MSLPLLSAPLSRTEALDTLFPKWPAFRRKQVEQALYQVKFRAWDDVSSLAKADRELLQAKVPWISFVDSKVLISAKEDTHKAMLTMQDGKQIETVLMQNRRGQWTICVSSQVGCAMGCRFCATGKMGFIRNLSEEEIADQYRFWLYYLADRPEIQERISNVVFMGMGEPLANKEKVKKSIWTWLEQTDIGETHITVSTVGVLPVLEGLLEDETWPPVRLALSLHSADAETRAYIVPSSHPQFLEKFEQWCRAYLAKVGNRKHHLTFEYVMLQGVNDTPHHAECLVDLCQRIGHVKVNLIPYNFTDLGFQRSIQERTRDFKEILERKGITVTIRKTMGDDIAAACGQLIK